MTHYNIFKIKSKSKRLNVKLVDREIITYLKLKVNQNILEVS